MCEIISFDLAKKLKEKGYPQDTEKHNAWYATEYYKNSCLGEYFEGELTNTYEYGDRINALHIVETENKGVVAPTISQVLKWLREEKKIHIGISPQWQYTVYDMRRNPWIGCSDMQNYDDYTKATLTGIEYCLDNLI